MDYYVIYLLQLHEHRKGKCDTFCLKWEKFNIDGDILYPKGALPIYQTICENGVSIGNKLLGILEKNFTKHPTDQNCFTGDIMLMIKIIQKTINDIMTIVPLTLKCGCVQCIKTEQSSPSTEEKTIAKTKKKTKTLENIPSKNTNETKKEIDSDTELLNFLLKERNLKMQQSTTQQKTLSTQGELSEDDQENTQTESDNDDSTEEDKQKNIPEEGATQKNTKNIAMPLELTKCFENRENSLKTQSTKGEIWELCLVSIKARAPKPARESLFNKKFSIKKPKDHIAILADTIEKSYKKVQPVAKLCTCLQELYYRYSHECVKNETKFYEMNQFSKYIIDWFITKTLTLEDKEFMLIFPFCPIGKMQEYLNDA